MAENQEKQTSQNKETTATETTHTTETANNSDHTSQDINMDDKQQPPEQTTAEQTLPPGYVINPATGQLVFVGQPGQQLQHPVYSPPNVVYIQQTSPEQLAAQQAAAQQRHGQIINSVERFLEGENTVSDVVKTVFTNTYEKDQLWKGIVVGAAAAVLLTSTPVRKAMGQTMASILSQTKTSKQTPDNNNK